MIRKNSSVEDSQSRAFSRIPLVDRTTLPSIKGSILFDVNDSLPYYGNGTSWNTLGPSSGPGVDSFSAGSTGLLPSTPTTGAVVLSGTLDANNGGTGLSAIGTSSQILGVNTGGTGLEYKSLVAGSNVTLTPAAGSITISASGGGGGGVDSFSGGSTGLLPSTPTTGAVVLSGTLDSDNGGTGLSTIGTSNQMLGVNTGGTGLEYKSIVAGANVTITPAAGSITIASTGGGAGVASFSGGSTGLLPNTATTGAVVLSGTLDADNGGTGLSTIGTSNQVLGVNTGGTALEYKSITAGTGISVTPSAGSLTIAATGGSFPEVSAAMKLAGTQLIASGGPQTILWDTSLLSGYSSTVQPGFTVSSGNLQCITSGVYRINASTLYDSTAATFVQLICFVNGVNISSVITEAAVVAPYGQSLSFTATATIASGQFVTIQVNVNNNTTIEPRGTILSIDRLQ